VSGFIYVLILFRLTIFKPVWILELDFSNYLILKYIGFTFVSAGFVLGILALVAMKNSWRVGIRYDQRTDLVTSGIYRFSRNPYFLSYYILIFGYVLIIPSVILFVLYVALAVIFHSLILDEEKYLLSVHRDSYLDYKRKVNRYLTVN
jgi:protein-S-isoprenylcysteine O-methyltransferase Ste14